MCLWGGIMGFAIAFDTLAYSQELQAAGVPAQQAEAMARAQSKALEKMVESQEIATKSDLLQVKQELIKWVLGVAASQTAIILAVIALLHKG